MLLGKKIFLILILLIFQNSLLANDFNISKGEKIFDEFKVNKKMKFSIPGQWEVIGEHSEHIAVGIRVEGVALVSMEDNVPVKYFEIQRATGLSKYQAYLTSIIEAATFNTKEDGCRKREHYNYLNFYKRGNSHNCMIVTILDVQRALNPDFTNYDANGVFSLGIRKWVEDNEIDVPKIYLMYESSFHSMAVRDEWYVMIYAESPEHFANYKPKFTSRNSTEFHPAKMENFPKAKKVMQKWLKKSAELHTDFEIFQKAKKSQKLDLSEFIDSTPKKNTKKVRSSEDNLAEKLIKLNKLYESGALTKDEFEKAKKKILN